MQSHSSVFSASSAQTRPSQSPATAGSNPATQEEKHPLFLILFLTDLSLLMTPPEKMLILSLVCKDMNMHLKSGPVCSMKATCNPHRSGNVVKLTDHITKNQKYLTTITINKYNGELHRIGLNLYRAISGCGRLQRLVLIDCALQRGPLTQKQVTDAWAGLKTSCPDLRYVEIGNVYYAQKSTMERIGGMLGGLGQLTRIKVLRLVNCQLLEIRMQEVALIKALITVIKNLTELVELSLSGNPPNCCSLALFDALCLHPELRSLELNQCSLRNEFLALLCRHMNEKKSGIRQLRVDKNAFAARTEVPQPNPDGLITSEVLVGYMCVAQNLTGISIRGNAICHTIPGCVGNPDYFSKGGFEAIKNLLVIHASLEKIDITGCGLTYDDCCKIILSSGDWVKRRTLYFSIDSRPKNNTEVSEEKMSQLVELAKSAGGDLVVGPVKHTADDSLRGPLTFMPLTYTSK